MGGGCLAAAGHKQAVGNPAQSCRFMPLLGDSPVRVEQTEFWSDDRLAFVTLSGFMLFFRIAILPELHCSHASFL